jgi:hypothetical protein
MSGMNASPPQDLVHHPVTDTGKKVLHQQDRLDRSSPSTLEDGFDQFGSKRVGSHFRWQVSPPIRVFLAAVKENASELSRVAKDEASPCLPEHEGIVLGLGAIFRLDA